MYACMMHTTVTTHDFHKFNAVDATKIPHTTVYTCKGWNKIKNAQYISSANITVIVT